MCIPQIINKFLEKWVILKKAKTCLIKFLYLTSISIASNASEVAHPEVMEVLVRIEAEQVATDQVHVSLYNKRFPIYSSDLHHYGIKKITMISEGQVYRAGLIEPRSLIPAHHIIYTHQFMTIDREVKLPAPGDILHPICLGGFWKPGCNLEAIEQCYIWFYEADDEIRYIIKSLRNWRGKGVQPPPSNPSYNTLAGIDPIFQQPLTLVDAIREGHCILRPIEGNNGEEQKSSIYYSIDIQPQGLTHAWISFIRNKSTNHPFLG